MNTIKIIRVLEDDVTKLQEIGSQTFYETFADTNTEENMKVYLEESFALEKLIQEVSNVQSQFYFAVLDDLVIGYLKINTGEKQTELISNDALEIERIYVLKAFQGKKIGQLLYDKAVCIAKDLGLKSIWLGVWEKNQHAIGFYQKNGFVEFDKHIFHLGEDIQTDLMMRKAI